MSTSQGSTSKFTSVAVPGLNYGPAIESCVKLNDFCFSRPRVPVTRLSCPPFASVSQAMRKKQSLDFLEDSVVDQQTGVPHPVELCDLRNGKCAQLMGVGPRKKRLAGIADVNVYSVGFYANLDDLRHHLGQHKDKDVEAMGNDADLLKDLKQKNVEKEIRMVATFRAVSMGTFWKALDTRLYPLLHQAGAAATLPKLKSHFNNVKFAKGTEITFAMSRNGQVSTLVNGDQKGKIVSDALCQALTDIYMGADPPSPIVKQDFLTSLVKVINPPVPEDVTTDP